MLQITLHLIQSSRRCKFRLLGLKVCQVRIQKKTTSTVSVERHKGAICDRLKIKVLVVTEASHQII
jgi:hypothetical protein